MQIASGYADGSIRIWDLEKGICETTLNGHKGAVTALRFNKLGSLLASGSKDNDIILWDVVGESGLFRLRGHRDQVHTTLELAVMYFSFLTSSRVTYEILILFHCHPCYRLLILFSWILAKSW